MEQTFFPSRDERISERTVEQVVDIPVHGRGVSSRGGPQGSSWLSRDRVQQRLVVVFMVFSRYRFQRRFLELNMSMEVQFPVNVLIMDVFKALLQDKVQQLVVELIFTSCCRRMWWMRSCRNEWLLMYFRVGEDPFCGALLATVQAV